MFSCRSDHYCLSYSFAEEKKKQNGLPVQIPVSNVYTFWCSGVLPKSVYIKEKSCSQSLKYVLH